MAEMGPKVGDLVLDGRYTLLREVKGSVGGAHVNVGRKGLCRYCSATARSRFRKKAHTFPEGLGNKWVFSLDECDDCNAKFSVYDEELVKGVSPFLTLGGVKGKGNKTRQTGRTAGDSVIMRQSGRGRPRISIMLKGSSVSDLVSIDPSTGRFKFKFPIASVPFKPRHAYKAVAKMGFALLPDEELANYQQLRAWLLNVNDREDFTLLDMAMSFGSIGNAPPMAAGMLLRRADPADEVPHILFIFGAGSLCMQIDLMSDHLDDHLPPTPIGPVNISWSIVVAGDNGQTNHVISYGNPIHFDWASSKTVQQPIQSIVLDFDPKASRGNFTPIIRP